MLVRHCLFGILALLSVHSARLVAEEPQAGTSPVEVQGFFEKRGKTVITFAGYSGAGYEDVDRMLGEARGVLSVHSPKKTIVNIGATASGIGVVYGMARKMGFETTGIVSAQAKKYDAEISPHVDEVFYVTDESWGGFKPNTQVLSPTSRAMVQCSDVIVCIGGGAVARDELTAAKREGKTIKYIPADMNHKAAIEKARKKGLPVPTDFKGAAYTEFGKLIGSK
jgi:hypothetical protein